MTLTRAAATRRAMLLASVGLPASLLTACRARTSTGLASHVDSIEVRDRPPGWLALPNLPRSFKFAVIGDAGRGSLPQLAVAAQMAAYHQRFAFPLVLMVGDNIYEGPATRDDYRTKFEEPYGRLLGAGVRFQAVLGNHDDPAQRDYPLFHMGGQRYYTFEPPGPALGRVVDTVRVFALDSTNLDGEQLAWLERELSRSRAAWKICMLHHPLYTGGRYTQSARLMRWRLETLLASHGVAVVFSGHEHFYQRSTVQQGVVYFVTGAAGSLREGDATTGGVVARAFDGDYHFMLVEVARKALHFQAITRTGRTIDAGVVTRS